ncbi:multiple sugar transport system permease protein/raffinose/stachyose/melibiose transport system permease protein [Microbacterium endophyticum]|uniref:Multiple sugar transport system permease protein/raffinose/stachyose/melibiose transport system permease protein n=1 Tax=Microbacterium endophyticum TaxID=1526412 RepID=A0A7W4V1D8_9MICO|nr:sugar ABC transporter permease [Microbacterium endophyticum]MBB2975077.1 multiple sugar transport system permease protein/raffinose/stachyose/melibiose transport system permease protein [Microbacterium endophyticum]NIK37383.1 multiple sugar transport system permease protein/raffinose/stachyose/melibiose transport system permease protein [Microbacterium endophyticum]
MKNVLGDRKSIAILLAPALVVYTLGMLIPVLWSLGLTFFEGNALFGFQYVGVANFVELFQDARVLDALWFTIRYAVIITAGQILLGYALSLLYTFALRRGSSVVRTLVFFPVVLPTVAVALLFQQMFAVAPQQGIVNEFLNFLGLSSVDWFGNPGTAFMVVILMDLWRSMGFYAVLLYAGLVDIPEDILESARLDGASGWRLVRHIVVPLSLPVLLSAVIFSINGTLKVFDSILALTNGGPGTSTTPLTLYMYQTSFSYGEYGYGSTIAMVLTILCLGVTVFIFRSARADNTQS